MQKRSLFFPNLDGLRFFSFLLVFLSHSFFTTNTQIKESNWYKAIKINMFSDAEVGVSFFFVLSGFLISYLLLKEKEETENINVPYFYIRRVLRIWPLYYLTALFGFFIFPLLKNYFGQTSHETADPLLCFTFLNNFNFLQNGLPDSSSLAILWSVAIEEQFYLVWPLLLFKTPKKYYLYVMLFVLLISTAFRIIYVGKTGINDHTLGVITDMAVGGIGAYLVIYNARFFKTIEDLPKSGLFIVYVLCLSFICFQQQLFYSTKVMLVLQRIIMSSVFIIVILEQNFCKNSIFKTGNFKLISKLGKYTYGLYCFHVIGILVSITVLNKLSLNNYGWQMWLLELPFSLTITIVLSYLSYHYFESPFLKLKDRFAVIKK